MDFRVIDSRPGADRKSGRLTDLITDCDYGVFRFGDDRTDPSRLAYLHDYLVNLLGKQLHGKSLEVTRFVMYLNTASIRLAEMRAGGPGGAPISSDQPIKPIMGSGCAPEKMRGGYYAATEVTTHFSPVIIEIEATYQSRKLRVRSVYSPTHELKTRIDAHSDNGAEYFAALHDANAELAERMIETAIAQ